MSSSGSWSAGHPVSTILVPANPYRAKLVIQCYTQSGPVNLGFGGNAAVAGQGLQLIGNGSVLAIAGPLAQEAVQGICLGTSASATGGYQEALGICS